MSATAASLGVPEFFNAADHFVDRHIREGRGATVAIECGDERITYAEVSQNVNRCASTLRDAAGVRAEERVLLLLYDGPAFAYHVSARSGSGPCPCR